MFLTFGQKTEYHVQAYLSMLSFRRQATAQDHFVMVTTAPEFYRHAQSWAEIVTITDEQVQQWQGKHQYMFRVKTIALCKQVEAHPDDHLLFVDTDTVLYGDLQQMREVLDQGTGLLHRNEGHPSQMKGPSQQMWKTVKGNTYGNITLGDTHCMWNSGIIGIPRKKMKQIADDTLMLLDRMLDDGVKSFNIEQYAMSVAMQTHVSLEEAYPYVAHYWASKECWVNAGMELLSRVLLTNATEEEEMRLFEQLDLSKLPINVHHSNTGRRLHNLVGKAFPDRHVHYLDNSELAEPDQQDDNDL